MTDHYALYYDGKLVGVITNPENYFGDPNEVGVALSPDEGLCHVVRLDEPIDVAGVPLESQNPDIDDEDEDAED